MAENGVYEVSTVNNSYTFKGDNTIAYGQASTAGGYYDKVGEWHPYINWTYPYWNVTYPATIYKYQIFCPRCETPNWLELDKIEVCTKVKCGAKLKAVTQRVDYEVPVTI